MVSAYVEVPVRGFYSTEVLRQKSEHPEVLLLPGSSLYRGSTLSGAKQWNRSRAAAVGVHRGSVCTPPCTFPVMDTSSMCAQRAVATRVFAGSTAQAAA